jgi:hypothetical protein
MTSPIVTPPLDPSPPPPPRRSPGTRLRDEAHHLRLWLRRNFTREQVTSNLKTLMWVAPLTVLIWIYAEREQAVPERNVPIRVSLSSDDPNRVITILSGDEQAAVDLLGPRSKIDRVKQELSQPGQAGMVNITVDLPLGIHELPLSRPLSEAPIFAQNRIEVSNVLPSTIRILVDEYVQREIEVTLPEADRGRISSYIFRPDTVRVRAPSQVFRSEESAGGLKAYGDLSVVTSLLRQSGVHELPTPVPVELSVARSEQITITPPTIAATIEVRRADAETEISSVPIYIGGPINLTNRYGVEASSEVVKNVVVVGPPEQIERINNNTAVPTPRFWLDITSADLPVHEDRQKALRWEGPEGVRVKKEPEAYTFRLVPADQVK